MKILIPLSLLIVGLAIGYIIGSNGGRKVIIKEVITKAKPIAYHVIHDTIIKTKLIEIEVPVKVQRNSEEIDTLDENNIELDTLIKSIVEKDNDTISDENLSILSDKRLKFYKLPIKHIEASVDNTDSLLKTAIHIIEVEKKYINIEFWESPINFSGYKLSKSKLVIYGLSPQLNYQLFKNKNVYYLKFHSIIYELYETEEFKKFVQTLELKK